MFSNESPICLVFQSLSILIPLSSPLMFVIARIRPKLMTSPSFSHRGVREESTTPATSSLISIGVSARSTVYMNHFVSVIRTWENRLDDITPPLRRVAEAWTRRQSRRVASSGRITKSDSSSRGGGWPRFDAPRNQGAWVPRVSRAKRGVLRPSLVRSVQALACAES